MTDYNLRKIHQLLDEGFSQDELRDFIFYSPSFRSVYDELGYTDRKREIIRKILSYAERKGVIDSLLKQIEAENPKKYAEYRLYFDAADVNAESVDVKVKPQPVDTKFIKLNNPYTFGVPVRGEDKFFGREQELNDIFNTLNNVPRGQKQDIVILGPRRIGKSSLLYRLDGLLTTHENFVSVYIDIQKINPKEPEVLFFKLLREIRLRYKRAKLLDQLPEFETLNDENIPNNLRFLIFDEDVTRLNDTIAAQNLPRLILMLDEVEVLLDFGDKGILGWFRGIIQSLLYATFIVAGSDRLYTLTQDYGSPFYNIFKTIELYPLSSDAAKRLLETPAKEIGMQISEQQRDKILRYAGNNPYFIQAIAHYLVEELNLHTRDSVFDEDIESVLEKSVDKLSAQFAYFWGQTSRIQRIILYSLAKGGKPKTLDELLTDLPQLKNFFQSRQDAKETFDDLIQQQLLKIKNSNHYWFTILLFATWILEKVDEDEVIDPASTLQQVQVYDIRAIRRFLTLDFDISELERLVFDHFPSVSPSTSTRTTKNKLIKNLLETVVADNELAKLLDVLKKANPEQFEVVEKDLYHQNSTLVEVDW